jgi:Bacterial archaeo-eukaryotic release factor family 10
VELRDRLDRLDVGGDRQAKIAMRESVNRIRERFPADNEPPPGRAQIGFVEVARKQRTEDWSSQQIPLGKTVVRHAPRPLLLPLIELLGRGRPHPVLAISADRVRGWIWSRGSLQPESAWNAELGIYPGHERKAPAMADPARGQATSSSGRDRFGKRLEENRKRFMHDLARRLAEDERVRGTELIALGEAPYLEAFAAALPSTVRLRALEGADVIGETDGAIAQRVGSEIAQGLAQREAALIRGAIDAAMAREGRGVVGANETSEALAEGRVDHLLLDSEGQIALDELSPPAREGVGDGGALDGGELMIELALRTSADVTAVGGEVAGALRDHGGAAALLRY